MRSSDILRVQINRAQPKPKPPHGGMARKPMRDRKLLVRALSSVISSKGDMGVARHRWLGALWFLVKKNK
jgi:hypothetical protein